MNQLQLLLKIQEATISQDCRLVDVLRMCKILAARLDHSLLSEWVDRELNGYEDSSDIPDYRFLNNLESRGYFDGGYGKSLNNAPIPLSSLPEPIRDFVSTREIKDSISSIESTVEQSKQKNEGILRSSWFSDILPLVGDKIYQYMMCLDAWTVVPASRYETILDIVKTRVLEFSLELEKKVSEVESNNQEIPVQVVNNIFNECILHNHHQTAISSEAVSIETQSLMNESQNNDFRGAQFAGGYVGGNVEGNQYGGIINNYGANAKDIALLITTLRDHAETFPAEQKDEVLDVLDELEGDLAKSEPNQARIRRRLKELVAITTAFTIGTTGFAADLAQLADTLEMPLPQVRIEQVQPDQLPPPNTP